MNKESLKLEKIKSAKLIVFAGPRKIFNPQEIENLEKYIDMGGNILMMCQEGGDKRSRSNLNEFLQSFNVILNNNSVVRTNFYKYLHPKEAYITNGVVQPDFIRSANNEEKKLKRSKMMFAGMGLKKDAEINEDNITGFNFVYPFGTTMKVKEPSIAILTSGSVCYPVNEVLLSMYESEAGGKLFVLGSWKMFSDSYFDKEENNKIFDFIWNNLDETETSFEPEIEENEPDKYFSRRITPNIEAQAEKLKNAI